MFGRRKTDTGSATLNETVATLHARMQMVMATLKEKGYETVAPSMSLNGWETTIWASISVTPCAANYLMHSYYENASAAAAAMERAATAAPTAADVRRIMRILK